MPGADRYVDGFGTTITCYWQDSPAELPQAILLSQWLGELRFQYPPFRQDLRMIDVWSAKRPDIMSTRDNGRIASCAGLTYSDGVMLINGLYANPGTLSHEVGHWQDRGIFDATDEHGLRMRGLWHQLRGWESTPATPPAERWAEDWRDLFGCSGVRSTTSPGDDGQREPWDVPGLRAFMVGLPAVLDFWRRVGWISNATVDDQADAIQWLRTIWWFWRRYERWRDGQFEYHDGARWVAFQP